MRMTWPKNSQTDSVEYSEEYNTPLPLGNKKAPLSIYNDHIARHDKYIM